MKCAFHMRANAQCPYEAMYAVKHEHKPRSSATRRVCAHHLTAEVENSLDTQDAVTRYVEVALAWEA